jgi:hypothetical protein
MMHRICEGNFLQKFGGFREFVGFSRLSSKAFFDFLVTLPYLTKFCLLNGSSPFMVIPYCVQYGNHFHGGFDGKAVQIGIFDWQ